MVDIVWTGPDHWYSGHRIGTYARFCVEQGYSVDTGFKPGKLMFHCVGTPKQNISQRIAKQNRNSKVVIYTHSCLAHIPYKPSRIHDYIDSINCMRTTGNLYLWTVDDHNIDFPRYRVAPPPLPEIKGEVRRTILGSKPKILLIGRDDPIKNFVTQVAGLKNVDADVTLVTDKTLTRHYRALLKLWKPNLHFTTYMDHGDWLDYLNSHDLVLQVSLGESCNNVSIEAMQMGIPVVSSPTVKCRVLSSTVFDPTSVIDIGETVEETLDNYSCRSQDGLMIARRKVKQTNDNFKKALEEMLCSS